MIRGICPVMKSFLSRTDSSRITGSHNCRIFTRPINFADYLKHAILYLCLLLVNELRLDTFASYKND